MLNGIRVLDLSRIIAGPYAAMLLADLGADVIKLERPPRGDDMRWLRGGSTGMGAIFGAVNRNKRGIAVDLRHPDGRKVAFELARRADVVLENLLPGGLDQLGLGYEAVRAANPAVVYASVSGFGRSGPYARRPGYNSVAMAMSGLMAITGMPGDPPTRPGGSISDLAASFLAFGAINAALVHRFRTGEGRHVDVDLLSSTLALLPDPVANYFDTGVRPGREGNRNPFLTPAEAFATGDGFLMVVLTGPDQWDRFCDALGDPEMKTDPAFSTNTERLSRHAQFKARVEARLATRPTSEWVERFAAASIAAGPIYEFDDVFRDPQVRHLGLVTETKQPGYGDLRMLGFPFRASGFSFGVRRPAPHLGEHTAEVLGELGLASAEVERLAAAGAVQLGSPPS